LPKVFSFAACGLSVIVTTEHNHRNPHCDDKNSTVNFEFG
jgi:hypothetical protein